MAERNKHPTFIGIGAQKCATTWIADVLGGHPDIFVPERKELDFFSHHYNRGFAWYRRFFEEAGEAIMGEVSPSYFTDLAAAERIRAAFPEMRLVLALRDPVERAFSNHLHELRKGHRTGSDQSFEAGLADNPMYVEQSRFGRHLERWLGHFPRDQLLVLIQEEITLDPVAAAERLYRFVGADPAARPHAIDERRHENVAYRSSVGRLLFRDFGRAARRIGLGGMVRRVKSLPGVAGAYRASRRDLRAEVRPIREATRAALVDELGEDMRLLGRLLERSDLPWPSWRSLP